MTVPSVMGHTRKGEEGGCAWVFKKEMLRLEEVPEILRKLDQEKKGWDLEGKRRPHKFFVLNGSKILVGSYTHLRRVGLEAYIEAFNTMVREVFRVTGDIGVEVLPVVFEDMDHLGREFVIGLAHWVEWIGRVKGRECIRELAGTGGRTKGNEECRVQYTQSFASMQNRQWGGEKEGEWVMRGNRLDLIRGERVELTTVTLVPSDEIGSLMRGRTGGAGEDEEKEMRESTKNNVSVEGEYTFTQAVGKFTRRAKGGVLQGTEGGKREGAAADEGYAGEGGDYKEVCGGSGGLGNGENHGRDF
jgi:hypothetical protein